MLATCLCGTTLEREEILSDRSDNPRVLGTVQPTMCDSCSDHYEELMDNADDYKGRQLAQWFLEGVR